MKKSIRALALFLALLMTLAVFVSCGETSDGTEPESETETAKETKKPIDPSKLKDFNIRAKADTYVQNGSSSGDTSKVSYLTEPEIMVKTNGSSNTLTRFGYVWFNISDLVDDDYFTSIEFAIMLSARQKEAGDPENICLEVYECDETADPKAVTFKNQPASKNLVAVRNDITSVNVEYTFPVTDFVRKAIASGKTMIAFRLVEDTPNASIHVHLYSTEAGINGPKLKVSYTKVDDTKYVPGRDKYAGDADYGTGLDSVLADKADKLSFSLDLKYTGKNPWDAAMTYVDEWTERWADIKKNVGASTSFRTADSTKEYTRYVNAATLGNTNGSSTKYTAYASRTLSTLNGFTVTDESANYDVYGGMTGGKTYKATGFFYVTFDGDRWIAVDPLGNPFFRTAVVTISTGSANQKTAIYKKYSTTAAWAAGATERLRELGFNSMGGWSDLASLSRAPEPLAGTQILYIMRDYCNAQGLNTTTGGSTTLVGNILPVFDPGFVTSADKSASLLAASKNSPTIFGWMSDNELPDSGTMLDSALSLDPTDARFAYTYAMAWTFLYDRTGYKATVSTKDITNELRREFRAMVYERYLKVCAESIAKYDPNHMYLGARFLAGCYKDPDVMKVAGKWCDVITFNYYNVWTPESGLIANIQQWANTPFIVTEWYAKGMDACTAESRLTNKSGAGWTVKTQADRGLFYQNFALKLLECKYCVGFDWFKYHDNDPDDKTADSSNKDSNKGIYSTSFEEYTDLTDAMQKLNLCKYSLIKFFDERNK